MWTSAVPRASAALLSACLLLCGCRHAQQASALTPREEALTWLDRNQPARALPLLEAQAAAAPDDLEVARALTEAHVRLGHTDAWLAELDRRLQAQPRAATHYMRGLALYTRAADASGPAIDAFRAALALAPREAELHFRLGVALLEAEREAESLPPLQRALELAPERTRFRLPLAKALARTGDRAGAVKVLGELVRQGPTPEEVGVARRLMEGLADPYEGFPKSAEPRLQEGLRALQELDMPQQAILAFEEVVRDFPDLAVVHALLGLAWQRLDDAGRAVEEFRRASELAPWDGHTWFYLGELYVSRQREEQARDALTRAVALHPLLDQAWFRLGDLALERRDLPRAREAFAIAVALQPEATPPRGKLALVHQLEGNWPGAERELKAVLEREPGSVEFMLRLGVLYVEQAERSAGTERERARSEARSWLQKVLEAQPENVVAARALDKVSAR